jgi:hypothetical protein
MAALSKRQKVISALLSKREVLAGEKRQAFTIS